MKIQLDQSDIEGALRAHLTNQGFALAGKNVSMDFTAGRKNTGTTVAIDITDAGVPAMVAEVAEAPVTKAEVKVDAPLATTPVATPEVAEATTSAGDAGPAEAEETAPVAAAKSLFGSP